LYLNKHDKSRIIFDHADPIYDPNTFIIQDWTEFNGDVEEELPAKMPEPLGQSMNITAFVNANHVGNVVTHRSHTGVIILRDGTARRDFVGYQEIDFHMIFDIKMDLTRKARFVAGGHMTETPASITYSSVISRDSMRIAS
jgi:hypothetical protein